MSTTVKVHSDALIRKSLHLLVAGVLLAGFAMGQEEANRTAKAGGTVDKNTVSDAIDKARPDTHESIYYVERIAQARAVQAVPMLEEKFLRTKDPLDKAHVASALVRLRDKNDVYLDYLVKLATSVIDAPDFWSYDSQGKLVPGPTPEFIAWAKAHKLAPAEMGEWPQYWIPGPVGLLGLTGDQRAVPLLRQALTSPNHMIEHVAAMGLAEIGDKGSVPFIIEACNRAPAEAASAIARSLVYFDDPEAQKAVDKYIPRDIAKAFREQRAQGMKPFGD
jgi:hypothetical protein